MPRTVQVNENITIAIGGRNEMNNLLRGGLAGAAAYKFGGGIFSMILIFIVVFWLLGKC
jgi:hypothetical protein